MTWTPSDTTDAIQSVVGLALSFANDGLLQFARGGSLMETVYQNCTTGRSNLFESHRQRRWLTVVSYLPCIDADHRKEYGRNQGSLDHRSGQPVVPGSRREDPRFRLFALTGTRSTAPNVVSPFSRCLGLLRRGPAQGPRPDRATRPGGVCHGPRSWAGYSPPSCTRLRTSWAGLSGAACSVSDPRSKPLNQEDSINGYQQQTRSGTQDRSRQGDRLGERGPRMGVRPQNWDRFRQRLRIGRSARFKFTSCSNSIGGR